MAGWRCKEEEGVTAQSLGGQRAAGRENEITGMGANCQTERNVAKLTGGKLVNRTFIEKSKSFATLLVPSAQAYASKMRIVT